MYKTQITLAKDAHILVVKLAGIGDLLLATPALRALRETYPRAQIDLLVTPDSAGLLNDWEVISNIIVLDKYLFDDPKVLLRNPRALLRLKDLWQKLRAGRYDAVLLLHHLTLPFGRLKHQLLMRATGARWRIGLDNGHGWFLNVRVKDNGFGALHEAEYTMAVAAAAGAVISNTELELPLQAHERARARQILREHAFSSLDTPGAHRAIPTGEQNSQSSKEIARPLIALHPGSGGYSVARRWPAERFAQLADELFEEVGGQILLLGGPEETELHQQIMSMLRSDVPACSLAGKGNIKVAAAILEQVDVFIGNDAGLMHIAAAVKAPTVGIFGLSNSRAWGPYTSKAGRELATVVQLNLPCIPCFYSGHLLGTPEGCATRDCLTMLGTDPVVAAARRMLRKRLRHEQQISAPENSPGNVHTN